MLALRVLSLEGGGTLRGESASFCGLGLTGKEFAWEHPLFCRLYLEDIFQVCKRVSSIGVIGFE